MSEKDLEARFQEAVAIASQMTQSSLPQDVQLRLYALYKQSTHGTITNRIYPVYDLRNAGMGLLIVLLGIPIYFIADRKKSN